MTFSMEIYVISEKHDFLSNYICLLNQIKKVCTFLYNQTFKYILHTILNMESLVPLILKITASKNITLFLKKHDLKKEHFFNKSNKLSMHILHNSTFQCIAHIDGKRKRLVHLIFQNHDFEKHFFISLKMIL